MRNILPIFALVASATAAQAQFLPTLNGDVSTPGGGSASTTISSGAVTTGKIAAGAVTSAKLATGAAAANLGFTPLNPASNLVDLTSPSAARVNLGLGSLAIFNTLATSYLTGYLQAGNFPALTGDCVTSAGSLAVSCGMTGGVSFGALATQSTVTSAQLPTPTASSLGGVRAAASTAHQWIAYIDASGVPHQSEPSFADISGSLPASQLAAGAAVSNLGFTPLNPANNLSDLGNVPAALASLGLSYLGRSATSGAGQLLAPDASVQFEAVPFIGAVNHLAVQGNISGGGPALISTGTDANVDINIVAQGQGQIVFGDGLGILAAISAPSGAFPSVYPVLQAQSGSVVEYTAAGGANVSVAALPLGNGGFWAGPAQTLTGTNAIALGRFHNVSGYAATAVGNTNYAAGNFSLVAGQYGQDHGASTKRIQASMPFSTTTHGVAQLSDQVQGATTSSTAPSTATADTNAATLYNTVMLQPHQTVAVRITVIARSTTLAETSAPGNIAVWNITGVWSQGATAASTTLIGSSGTTLPAFSYGAVTGWSVSLGTNTSGGYGYVSCTGPSADTVRWVVDVHTTEDQNG